MFLAKIAIFGAPIMLFVFFFMPRAGGQAVWCAIYALVLALLSVSFGCYQIGVYRLRTLLWSFCAATFFTNAVAVLQIWLIFDVLMIWRILWIWLLQCFASMVMFVIANAIYFKISPPRPLLAVCRGTGAEEKVIERVTQYRDRFILSEILPSTVGEAAIKRAIDGVPAVLLGDIEKQLRDELTSYCFDNNKRLYIIPDLQDVMMHEAHLTQIGDNMVFMCKNRNMTYEQAVMKRAMDIVGSAAALVALSPVFLLVAIAIKCTDGGPVFYSQRRLTKDGKPFTMHKFRSMVIDAEAEGKPMIACDGDARVTLVGRVIRRLRIDELPQLWNILKGEMSLVGPRPERPEIMEQFIKDMPTFRYRLKVKAGLTGYAQVFGRYSTPFEEKVKMDVYYIAHYSLMLDLQILLSTVRILFMKDSAQGVARRDSSKAHANRDAWNACFDQTAFEANGEQGSMVYTVAGRRQSGLRRRQDGMIKKVNDPRARS
jgi:exopolysaccharide biosynthesis polyprenyl glycosylphosphotransferase